MTEIGALGIKQILTQLREGEGPPFHSRARIRNIPPESLVPPLQVFPGRLTNFPQTAHSCKMPFGPSFSKQGPPPPFDTTLKRRLDHVSQLFVLSAYWDGFHPCSLSTADHCSHLKYNDPPESPTSGL